MILASYTIDYALFEGTLVLYQDAGLGHMYQKPFNIQNNLSKS